MKLYHGTNVGFDAILLDKCLPYKDFGKGFYLTDIKDQAERMAKRKCRREGEPVVMEYNIDDEVLNGKTDLNILRFDSPNQSWAEFVLANRERKVPPFKHDYDIVIGPVADDGIAYILSRYQEGSFSLDDVVRELQFKQLNSQYCFCTEKAINFLKQI